MQLSSDRKTAIIAGVLFIIGFTGVLTLVLTKPLLDDPDYLVQVAAHTNRITVGAFFQFTMAAACAGIGISLYPVLKRYSEGLALGAVGFRIIEAVFQIVGVIILLLLVTLSREFIKAGSPGSSHFQTFGALLLSGNDWVNQVAVLLSWSTGALMYYYIFYRTKLIPRWLSGWGLAGITLTIAGSMLFLFHLIASLSTIQVVLNLPIALQEIVLAIWLIVKGFDPSALAPGSKVRSRSFPV